MLPITLILAIVFLSSADGDVIVSTPLGQLSGKIEDESIVSFLGVPYAVAPVGDLRFRLPESPKRWNGTLDATKHGPACYQEPLPFSAQSYLIKESEDCLILDIYVDGTQIDGKSKMPVVVYIHGGAFIFGTSSMNKMTKFVAGRGIVAVVIQYRLGLLGFASSPDDETIPANIGLHDQIAALKWVKSYIQYFNGDPESVTIAGESAGAISAAFHLLSPLSTGLFNRAILESGAISNMKLMDRQTMDTNMMNLIQKSDCKNKHENAYECLRSLPINRLIRAQSALKPFFSIRILGSSNFFPTVDSRFFAGMDPVERAMNGNFTCKLDSLIIGHNGNEGALFLMLNMPLVFPIVGRPLRRYRSKFEMRWFARRMDEKYHQHMEKMIDLTFEDRYFMRSVEMANKLGKITGDISFACPNRQLVQWILNFDPQVKIYYYHFSYRSKDRIIAPYIDEALHAGEVSWVYGNVLEKPAKLTPDQVHFAETLVDNWTNFAKTARVKDDKWKHMTREGDKVEYNHIAFIEPTKIEYRTYFPENYCDKIKSLPPLALTELIYEP